MVAQLVENLPSTTLVRSLCQGDTLEKEMATHIGIFAREIPWTDKPGRLQSMGLQESHML